MLRRSVNRLPILCATLSTLLACEATAPVGKSPQDAGAFRRADSGIPIAGLDPAGMSAGGATGAPGIPLVPRNPISIDGGAAPGDNQGNGCVPSPESCNGLDDDCNGIVDDLDVDSDGVCDCIRIATLGKAGTWGKGDVFGAWLSARASDGAKSLGNQVLTPELIKGFQILVVEDVRVAVLGRQFSADEVAAVEDWVRRGGGLMTLIGYADSSEVNNVNLLLAPYGMAYQPKGIMPGFMSMTTPIKTFPAQHPLTANVKALGANNGYPVTGAGTVYAMWNSYAVGLAQEVDEGHVNLWGDEWITYNSEWTNHPDYQVQLFWINTVKWLTPVNVCQVAIPPEVIF